MQTQNNLKTKKIRNEKNEKRRSKPLQVGYKCAVRQQRPFKTRKFIISHPQIFHPPRSINNPKRWKPVVFTAMRTVDYTVLYVRGERMGENLDSELSWATGRGGMFAQMTLFISGSRRGKKSLPYTVSRSTSLGQAPSCVRFSSLSMHERTSPLSVFPLSPSLSRFRFSATPFDAWICESRVHTCERSEGGSTTYRVII